MLLGGVTGIGPPVLANPPPCGDPGAGRMTQYSLVTQNVPGKAASNELTWIGL
jgi:hypothetical protein